MSSWSPLSFRQTLFIDYIVSTSIPQHFFQFFWLFWWIEVFINIELVKRNYIAEIKVFLSLCAFWHTTPLRIWQFVTQYPSHSHKVLRMWDTNLSIKIFLFCEIGNERHICNFFHLGWYIGWKSDRFITNDFWTEISKFNTIFWFPQLNGIQTQGENIADNGGLAQSFKVSFPSCITHAIDPSMVWILFLKQYLPKKT